MALYHSQMLRHVINVLHRTALFTQKKKKKKGENSMVVLLIYKSTVEFLKF